MNGKGKKEKEEGEWRGRRGEREEGEARDKANTHVDEGGLARARDVHEQLGLVRVLVRRRAVV